MKGTVEVGVSTPMLKRKDVDTIVAEKVFAGPFSRIEGARPGGGSMPSGCKGTQMFDGDGGVASQSVICEWRHKIGVLSSEIYDGFTDPFAKFRWRPRLLSRGHSVGCYRQQNKGQVSTGSEEQKIFSIKKRRG